MIKTGLRKVFTLAEVLTTLMVIGVVAAMTIPTLLNSTDDQQYKVAFKKSVSVLSQAIQLNQAKEVVCIIKDSKGLCDCMAQSMAGTCSQIDNNTKGSTLTTPDGISFTFFYRGNDGAGRVNGEMNFVDQCDNNAPSSENDWKGIGAKCIVMVDTNGFGKGSHSIATGIVDSNVSSAIQTQDAVKDQFPVLLSTHGVYPAITEYDTKYGHIGYDYMYGSGSGVLTPFSGNGSKNLEFVYTNKSRSNNG